MTIKPNIAIECDTLAFLERVDDNSVDLVYVDPPWSFEQGDRDDYYEFIFKIIQHSYRCLKNSGSLFFYSNPDLNTDFHLLIKRKFDPENFITEFVIPRNSLGLNANTLVQVHDTVILYTKSREHSLNFRIRNVSSKQLLKLFPYQDKKGHYRTSSLYSAGYKPTLTFTWKGINLPDGQQWKYSMEKLEELYKDELILMRSGKIPYLLKTYYEKEDEYVPIGSVWGDISSRSKSSVMLGVQSEELLDRIIEIGTKQDDVILDPLCGSGTSIVVALKKKRKIIACDNSPAATVVLQQRLEDNQLENDIKLRGKEELQSYSIVNNTYLRLNPTDDDHLFDLILKGESHVLEFKESACWNYNSDKFDKNLIDKIIKSIAAFFNSSGGTLLIGVKNDKDFIDLKKDFETADPGKADKDGYELYLNNKINTLLGPQIIGKYKISFHVFNDCEICKIEVTESKVPIFFFNNFYVRNNNQSLGLSVEQFYFFMKSKELI